jgi:hypothetical protein
LRTWDSDRAAELDEIEQAHRAMGGAGRGRRYATLQINHAYTVLLSSQFQRFCRDLHTECVRFLAANVRPVTLRPLFQADLLLHRRLDRFNPTPGTLGADFDRLGLPFWDRVKVQDADAPRKMRSLEDLNSWRNAIAHGDFTGVGGLNRLRLQEVRAWRSTCSGLARVFDVVLYDHLSAMIGSAPW